MKLITKTTLYYLLISLPLLALAGFYSYRLINEEVKSGTDESLFRESINLRNLVKSLDSPRNIYLSSDKLTGITIIPEKKTIGAFSDTVVYDRIEEETLQFRVFRSYFYHKGTHYLISCAKPTLEEDELKEGLITSFIVIFLFLIAAIFVVNIGLSRTLWKPFYKTIDLLNKYDITNEEQICFDDASTKEFKRLNEVLNKMTQKITSDYRQQKEFTENASHELQTPLAVIQSKLDLLIQSPRLSKEDHELLQALENSVQKISTLNKALLLLTKIENHQFKEQKEIALKQLLTNAIETYQDLYQSKNIQTEVVIQNDVTLKINPVLADLLIGNLIKNAFRHNQLNGTLRVELNEKQLVISNSGEPLQMNPEELFTRFKKSDASKESLGLGLSIVKSIASVYHYNIQYTYKNNQHLFTLSF